MKGYKRILILTGLLLCMGSSTIMQTYFTSALPFISESFNSVKFYSWIHVSYILGSSSVIVLSSEFCQRFGNKKNFFTGSLLFGLGTIIATLSGSMLQLVIARIVMGIGAGVVIPATYGIIGDYFEKENYSAIFAAFAVVQIIFSGLGSLAGGYLPQIASWQAIFYILFPIELLSFWFVLSNIFDDSPVVKRESFQFRHHFLIMLSILLTTLGIEQAYHHNYLLLLLGSILIFYVASKDNKSGNILLPKECSKDSLLRNLCIQVFLLGGFYNVCIAYLPSFMQFTMGLSAKRAGNLLTIFVVLMGIGSILGGIFKISERFFILAGWGICLIGSFFLHFYLTFSVGVLGLGSGVLMSVLLGYIATRTQGHSSEVNSTAHLIRNFGGSFATILFQFSLWCPKQYYIWGVILLALLGMVASAVSFRRKYIINEHNE